MLSTTTRPDVYELTSGLRARRGPIAVFNPQGIGGITAVSTFRWSPIEGCEDRAVAIRRADAFANALPQEGENKFFRTAARAYLRAMFHAAALIKAGHADGGAVGADRHQGRRGQRLRRSCGKHGAPDWAAELAQLRGKAERTNATNEMVMGQMIGFMADPALAASALPGREDLDLATFLRHSGTLYMIADADGNEESPIAPLFAAMAAEVHHVAARIGQASPSGRLDPPLLMALDEIVQVCPVPLPSWLADSGGKGIQIIPVVHGEAQLRTRWKADGARAVMDTCGVKVWLPGITDTDTLDTASKLCGKTAFREKGEERHSRHEVMTPDMVRAAARPLRPGRPRRPVTGRDAAPAGLEGQGLPARPPRRLGRLPHACQAG